MSRDLPSALSDELELSEVTIFYAIELFFDTSTLRFWSGLGELSFGGETYVGSGNLISISSVEENIDISAKGATLTLSGLPSDMLSLAISEPYQGRKCKIYFGVRGANVNYLQQEDGSLVLNEDGSGIITSVLDDADVASEIFSGYIDQMNIDEGPETSSISVYVESRLIDLQRPRERRYTSESQKSRFPNDRGFEFVEDLQAKKFQWGR